MACVLQGNTLTLSGDVGDYWGGDCFTYAEVLTALAQVDDKAELTLHINSGGGIAYEGAAIHALLRARKGRTNVVIDGVAASAGSLIAMAGRRVTMTAGAVMMVHDPAGITIGTAADHGKTIEQLETLATSYARVYAAKSGKTADECREIMRVETWFTPEAALEAGFADATTDEPAATAAAHPYQQYTHAPAQLVAMAKTQGWNPRPAPIAGLPATPAAPVAEQPPKEEPMGDTNQAAGQGTADLEQAKREAVQMALKADRERRGAIMALPETKGREALAAHLESTTEMTVDQVKATLAAAPVAQPTAALPDPAEGETRAPGAGLGHSGGTQPGKPAMRVSLVDEMKQRHGLRQ